MSAVTQAIRESEPTKRRPFIGAEDVNKWHRAAMRALGDVVARRKWGDSKPGSPVTVMVLCEDVSRLQIARADLLTAANLALARLGELNRDDEAGIRMVLANAIAKAEGREP